MPCMRAALLVARHPALPAMASLRVLTFDHEGRPIQFNTWLDNLKLYLLSDSRDNVSLLDHTSGASLAPPATAKSANHSQRLTRRLLLPYLFPELSAFATVEDLVTHLRTSNARYRAALPAEFLDRNPPPMYITLYFIVTHLPSFSTNLVSTSPPALACPALPSLRRGAAARRSSLFLVYVDDLVFATADTQALALVKSKLQKRHTCTDLGELRSYLGLRITRDRAQRTITLTQSHMVQQVLQRFGFLYSSPQSTPLPTGHSLSAPPSDESVEPSGLYPELVGCLMYLMTCIRPDLAYHLGILARYVAPGRHTKEHMDAAKRVLRYLCSTSGMGLVLGGRARVVLTGHADASWSTRSFSVLSSSCEAEIYAGAMAAQELRWLTYLLTDLGERPCSSPVLNIDNKAMIALCQEHRTKHIALRYFLARELQ
ncbi:unnamed protein product [Closterium sp. NIES-53]